MILFSAWILAVSLLVGRRRHEYLVSKPHMLCLICFIAGSLLESALYCRGWASTYSVRGGSSSSPCMATGGVPLFAIVTFHENLLRIFPESELC